MRVFVTGTGTGVGKTVVARGLARAFARRGRTHAFKPYETGVASIAEDARALAWAAESPQDADVVGFYRCGPPLSPHGAEFEGVTKALGATAMKRVILNAAGDRPHLLVEGAGGLLVPLSARETFADLGVALAWPVVIVAPNRLGVLSDVLATHEAATRRDLVVAAIVLSQPATTDLSQRTNQRVLEARGLPIVPLPRLDVDDDDALADAIEASGLLELL